MTAARGTPGGLHFGHFFGCFRPMRHQANTAPLLFVIKDNAPMLAESESSSQSNVAIIAEDAYSCAYEREVVVCRFSDLVAGAPLLYNALFDLITINGIFSYHFRKEEMRSKENSASLKLAVFPLEEAFQLFAVNAQFLVCNDDNIRFVKLARDLVRKLKPRFPSVDIRTPELLSNPAAGRLLGYDYRRMSKGNGNTLRIRATPKEVDEYVESLGSLGRYFDAYPKQLERFNTDRTAFEIDNGYLPFIWLRGISDEKQTTEIIESSRNPHRTKVVKDHLKSVLNAQIAAFASMRANLGASGLGFSARLKSDRQRARELSRDMQRKWGFDPYRFS